MKTKAILFDADGLVVKRQQEYFSVKFAREYGAPVDELTEFFKTTFRECQDGKADLKDELAKLLPAWGWSKGTDAFLEYWFTSDIEVDPKVLRVIEEYRSKGVTCYLATDVEKYRAAYLREHVGLDKYFDGYFFSYELHANKSQPKFFESALRSLNLPASEVSYRDDDKKNVEVAKGLGIDARWYDDISDLRIEQNDFKIPRA